LLPAKEEANFSIVNFNALPEAYIPPSFSIARVLIPVGAVIGIGLIIFGVILVMNNRTEIATLQSEVTATESHVAQLQRETATLKTQVDSAAATAGELNNRLTAIERGRATIAADLDQIERLARQRLTLSNINYAGSSVTVKGTASDVWLIYDYARDLRALTDATKAPIFPRVWISSISQTTGGYSFSFALSK
jgi:outer membrane murein-binding lipoprotein Lpp